MIENKREYESYLDLLNSDSYNEGTYNKLKEEIDAQFFENKSLIIFKLENNSLTQRNEEKLLTVKIQDENAKIRIKKGCGSTISGINLGIMYCIPIDSKTIDTVELKFYTMDKYDEILNVCKMLLRVLGIISGLIIVAKIFIFINKIENKTIKILLNIAIILFGFLIGLVGMMIYESATETIAAKPVIYLYPEKESEVEVKVTYPEKLTCTYPKYEESWKVLAEPTGDLTELETGRSLYCLYYEGLNTIETLKDEGFVVKGEDTISFLEEKLEILGCQYF